MVILAVGIMTVIQMFPFGFTVVRNAESRTIATKLAQREVEMWKNMSANLPTGILAIDENGNPLTTQLPGPPFVSVVEVGKDTFSRGNVLNMRQIWGETVKVPVGTYFSTGSGNVYGSQYSLAFSPIDVRRDNGELSNFVVKSTDLTRRVADQDYDPPYLSQNSYAIDYKEDDNGNTFYVAFPKSGVDHVYYLTYSYWVDNGGQMELHTELDVPIDVPADKGGQWIDINMPNGAAGIEPDTESCARGFKEVPQWSDDPYEFALADDILGVIAFNPKAHGMTSRIDYQIRDPRIIREDRLVPQPQAQQMSNGDPVTIPIKLSLRFILNAGDPGDVEDGDATDNPDEPTFEGLIRKNPTVRTTSADDLILKDSILVIDLATGYRVVINPDWIDFKAGIVNLPETATLTNWDTSDRIPDVSLPGRHLRFFYRADGDWAVQCQKAYAMYYRDYGNTSGSLGMAYDHYAFNSANQLIFAPCAVEQTVSVDYSYYDSSGIEHKVVGESHQIDKDTDNTDDYHVDLLCNNVSGARVSRIFAVVGTSFRARVIWRDGTNWRYVDMDTNLVRSKMD